MLTLVAAFLQGNKAYAQSSSQADDDTTVVYDGRLLGDEESTRLILNLDKKFKVRVLHVTKPDRIVLESENTLFNFAEDNPLIARGLVSSLRYGAVSQTRSRIVLTLKKPAIVKGQEITQKEDDGRYRFILDFSAVAQAEFQAQMKADQKKYGASGQTAEKGDRVKPVEKKKGRFVIIIDPGHGGIDTGASGSKGTKEKNITLMVARQLADSLKNAGPFDVYLTRDDDYFLTLKQRVAIAKRHHADLFVSLHADSLRQRGVRGATVYTLSQRASDKLAQQVADGENAADLTAGLAAPEERDIVVDILAELTTRETMKFSHGISNLLVDTLGKEIRLIKNPQRSAAFGVLKAPEIPGVLIEMGYLSNRRDETLMRSPKWREKVARAITKAIRRYFEPRLPK